MNVLAKKINSKGVGRAPIRQLEQFNDNFVKELDARLRQRLRTITETMIIDYEVRKLSSVLEEIPFPAMLAVYGFEQTEDRALVNLSNDLTFHVIDIVMSGDPSELPTPTALAMTEIGCTICLDFVNEMLASFSDAMSTALRAPMPEGLKLFEFEQHATMLSIAPDNADVLVIKGNVDIGDAARNGDFELIVPFSMLDILQSAARRSGPRKQANSEIDLWSGHMRLVASCVDVRVYSVLQRLQIPVKEVKTLEVGQMLTLSPDSMEDVSLVLGSTDASQSFATGKLGMHKKNRAVKLTKAPDPGFQTHLSSMMTEAVQL
ncbi:MAG: FliM/FliN family flagellar motor switch protein [Pseudomonadota bacterium]